MSARDQLLGHYRAILAAAESMREAAVGGDWPQVSVLALRIRAITEQLDDQEPALVLGHDGNRERLCILTRLVNIDSEVRYLREPWLSRLDELIVPVPRSRPIPPLSGHETP